MLFPPVATPVCSPTNSVRGLPFPTSLAALVICELLNTEIIIKKKELNLLFQGQIRVDF